MGREAASAYVAHHSGRCPRATGGGNRALGERQVTGESAPADVRSGIVTGVTVVGVRGHLVAVQAHVGRGLPSLTLTGPFSWTIPWTASGCRRRARRGSS